MKRVFFVFASITNSSWAFKEMLIKQKQQFVLFFTVAKNNC